MIRLKMLSEFDAVLGIEHRSDRGPVTPGAPRDLDRPQPIDEAQLLDLLPFQQGQL
jgi:hypothetical protein